MAAEGIDLLAFTGHKCLGGPTGTGGLILGERVDPTWITPLKQGGTGSRSADEVQPTFLPDVFESGTLNVMGLAGLLAAVRWVRVRGVDLLRADQISTVGRLLRGLSEIPGIVLPGLLEPEGRMAAVSFNIAGMAPSEVGLRLDEEHGVLCRVGLHCAPAAHRTMGTAPGGTVRLAPGAFTSARDIDTTVAAVATLAAEARSRAAGPSPGVRT
jgi:selenocysteine lyase/cysteine desulfurase